jgi:flagellar export protein FliJ
MHEGIMPVSTTLIELAERRVETALTAWRHLRARCDEARSKLSLLKQHRESYGGLMHAALQHGMSASSLSSHLSFIGQIETVVVRQQSEVGSLEEGCARLWQDLLEARREKRMLEILNDRAKMREAEKASRSRQMVIDEMLQRAGKAP